MEPKLILRSFSAFGLNTYEAKSYLSLLEKDRLSAVEVAKLSGVPRGRVYEILDNLLTKGFCRSIPGKVKYYSAVNPTVLREKLTAKLKSVESEVDKKKHELSLLKKNSDDIIESLIPLFNESRKNGNPLEYIEIIKDHYQGVKRFMEISGKATKEILIFSKPPYTTSSKEIIEEQYNQQRGLLERGIKIKDIYEIRRDMDDLEWWYNSIDHAAKLGEEARVIKELPIKMAIFDGEVVMLPLEDPISSGISFTSQIIRHPALAKTLKIVFETLWAQAEDYLVLEDLLKEDLVKTK